MCAAKPPKPEAPPPPTPVRDTQIEGRRALQNAARRTGASGYESTMLTGPGGVAGPAPTASPVLGA